MAKMHSRKKGTSGSMRPVQKKVPSWLTRSQKEVELLIVKLAKEDKKAAEIGLILRDTYGIPNVKAVLKKKVTQILKEHNLKPNLPYDLTDLIRKALIIRKHLEANKQDMAAGRGLILTESKIKRLTKYYKNNEMIPQDWKYDHRRASLIVQ